MKRFIPSKPGFWAVCPHPMPPAKRSRGWEAVSLVTLTGHWMALWTPGCPTQFKKEKTVLRTGISNTFTEHKTYFSYSTQSETQSLCDYMDMNNMTASLFTTGSIHAGAYHHIPALQTETQSLLSLCVPM